MIRGVGRSLGLVAAGTILAPAASAQSSFSAPATAVMAPAIGMDSGAELRRHLTALAQNPRSLHALIAAGRAALRSGDPEAALSFFARANEISPRDPRVKAGMGSAMVQLGQAQTALSFFGEAVAMGAPLPEIAGDRGLAYDMMGQPQRAQQDYTLAMQRGYDPELRRRMALSLAITGDREAALRMIDDQLRRNVRAAWRSQAFILALTGDPIAAARTAQGMMSYGTAAAMAPFLAGLPALSPAQKAMAVHFGHFPRNAPRPTGVAATTAYQAAAPAVRPPVSQPVVRPVSEREERDVRRQPARDPRAGIGFGILDARNARREARSRPESSRREPAAQRDDDDPAPAAPTRLARWSPPTDQPEVEVAELPAPIAPATESAAAPVELAAVEMTPLNDAVATALTAPASSSTAPAAAAPVSFSRVAGLVYALPTEGGSEAAPADDGRHWVRIAGGIDVHAAGEELARLREQAPEQLGDRPAFTTPMGSASWLVVGPFETLAEAQALADQLAGRRVTSFAWTSPASQEIHPVR